jgi:hypothetical protein
MINNSYYYIMHYPKRIEMFHNRNVVTAGCGYEHTVIIDS